MSSRLYDRPFICAPGLSLASPLERARLAVVDLDERRDELLREHRRIGHVSERRADRVHIKAKTVGFTWQMGFLIGECQRPRSRAGPPDGGSPAVWAREGRCRCRCGVRLPREGRCRCRRGVRLAREGRCRCRRGVRLAWRQTGAASDCRGRDAAGVGAASDWRGRDAADVGAASPCMAKNLKNIVRNYFTFRSV